MLKFSIRRFCQPGVSVLTHSGSVGRLPRTSTDDGVRWKTYSCLRVLAEVRHALDGGRAGADDRDALVGEPVQIAVGIAAGVAVVPAAGVEGVPLEAVDAGDAGQLRPVQRPVGHHDEARAHAVVAVGGDDPAALVLVPA